MKLKRYFVLVGTQSIVSLLATSLFANPIHIQKDQIDYTIYPPTISENNFEYFHSMFIHYYPKTLNELNSKKKIPIVVNIFTDSTSFKKISGLPSFVGAGFNPENENFYFLLNENTLKENQLITLISHESCHSAIFNLKNTHLNSIKVLEEGLCYFHYPPLNEPKVNIDKKLCNLTFENFIIQSNKLLKSNQKSKRQSAYKLSAQFIQFIEYKIGHNNLIQLLESESNKEFKTYWKYFDRQCKN